MEQNILKYLALNLEQKFDGKINLIFYLAIIYN
jgi:hypothetical protein